MSSLMLLDNAAQPVQNLVWNPRLTNSSTGWTLGSWGTGGAGSVSRQTSGGPGFNTPFFRLAMSTPGSGTMYGGFEFTSQPLAAPLNRVRNFSMWVRASASASVRLNLWYTDSSGSAVVQTASTYFQTIPANTWTRISYTSAPTTASVLTIRRFIFEMSNASVAAGMNFDATMAQVTDGTALYDYSDGDTPGWRWSGTIGSSMSYGYPYTLASAAGGAQPRYSLMSAGTVGANDFYSNPFIGRTLYTVHDILSIASDYPLLVRLGTSLTGGDLAIQGSNANSTQWRIRVDTVNGSSNAVPVINNVRTVARHVTVGRLNDGLTVARVDMDNRTSFGTIAITPGGGIPESKLVMYSPNASDAPIAAYSYDGYHSDSVMQSICRWLAVHYGFQLFS